MKAASSVFYISCSSISTLQQPSHRLILVHLTHLFVFLVKVKKKNPSAPRIKYSWPSIGRVWEQQWSGCFQRFPASGKRVVREVEREWVESEGRTEEGSEQVRGKGWRDEP